MSSLIPAIKTHLSRPGKDIAIVEVEEVRNEFDDVFVFVERFQNFTNEEWNTELLRDGHDGWTGNYIVLATYPNEIHARDATGKRLYIVISSDELDQNLVYNHIQI